MEFIHNKLQPFLVKSSGGRGAEGCSQGAGGGGKGPGAGGQGAGAGGAGGGGGGGRGRESRCCTVGH